MAEKKSTKASEKDRKSTNRTTINTMVRDDPEQLKRYMGRVASALAKMDAIGWGARSRCGFDLQIHPSRVSDLLNGRNISTVDLTLIEGWLEEQGDA